MRRSSELLGGREQHGVGMKISILNPVRCLPKWKDSFGGLRGKYGLWGGRYQSGSCMTLYQSESISSMLQGTVSSACHCMNPVSPEL